MHGKCVRDMHSRKLLARAVSSAFGEYGVHSLPETIQRCLRSFHFCMHGKCVRDMHSRKLLARAVSSAFGTAGVHVLPEAMSDGGGRSVPGLMEAKGRQAMTTL
jgi:hypothetical protein